MEIHHLNVGLRNESTRMNRRRHKADRQEHFTLEMRRLYVLAWYTQIIFVPILYPCKLKIHIHTISHTRYTHKNYRGAFPIPNEQIS